MSAFPEGLATPLYTWGSMCMVTMLMIIAQVDIMGLFGASKRLYMTVEVAQRQEGPYSRPALITLALVVVTWAIVGLWWTDTASPWGFKVAWVTASVVISTPPILAVLPYYRWGDNGDMTHAVAWFGAGRLESAGACFGIVTYSDFVFATNYVCLGTLLIMSMLCLFMFPAAGSQIDTLPRSALVATGAMIFVLLLGDLVVKRQRFSYLTKRAKQALGIKTATQGLIDNMVANKRAQVIELNAPQLKTPTANFASLPPLTFSRTQGVGFPRDDPVHMLVHQVENKMIRPDRTTTLGIKDYQIIQTNENQAIVVSSKDGNALMNFVPGAELNCERHGLLAPVNHFGEDTSFVEKTVEPEIKSLAKSEKKYTDRFFFRIFDREQPVLFYENYVLGMSKGNGVFINTPGFLPIFLSAYFFAIEMQIWRSTGIGLMVSMITLAPCFVFAYIGHERSYLHLFWLNRMLGFFIIVVQRGFGYVSPSFIMDSTVILDTTDPWLYSSATNADQITSVRITTWLAFSLVLLWILGATVKFCCVTVKE